MGGVGRGRDEGGGSLGGHEVAAIMAIDPPVLFPCCAQKDILPIDVANDSIKALLLRAPELRRDALILAARW